MNLTNTEVQEIIHGTEYRIEIWEQGFRTLQPSIVKSIEKVGNLKRIGTQRGEKREGDRGRDRIGNTLKQRKLEDSLKSKEERKRRKRRRKELVSEGVKVKRTPQETEKMGEDIAKIVKKTMDIILHKVDEINTNMDGKREDREKMIESWEQRYIGLEKKLTEK
ncbi:hypothetical protein TSAR_013084 [Trichomalopsis sarcophagae]|uniref:Uncharacterized protein n=1 Tax=Trichomalopsis sarcophagae TaxID=543379 RepID=A0A232FMS2_9HYME|nr:hypothetical protein TSAR_013084 [Trichomalopsis sarcophagae]